MLGFVYLRYSDSISYNEIDVSVMIKVGTSGFSFPDWVGAIYPDKIKKGDMLLFYEQTLGFKITEINSTYYTIPSQKSFEGMLKKTSPDFEFTVKAHKSMTHEIRDKETGVFIDNKDAFDRFVRAVEPVKKEDRLTAILAQFPYSFYAVNDNYNYLLTFKERLKDMPLVVEFRNYYWHTQKSISFLRENNIGYCIVDEPKLKGLMPYNPVVTTDLGYFRFHGRNMNWFQASTAERYDYLRTPEELKSIVADIKNIRRYRITTLLSVCLPLALRTAFPLAIRTLDGGGLLLLRLFRLRRLTSRVITNTDNSTIDLIAGDSPFSSERSLSDFISVASMSIFSIVKGWHLYKQPVISQLRLLYHRLFSPFSFVL